MTGRSILVTVCLKKVFLLGTNILITSMVIGQVNFGFRQTDSLKHELSKATVDTSKAILMVSLAEAYRWSKPDSAMVYVQEALAISRQRKFRRGEAAALNSLSVLYRELGNLPLALDLALKGLQISKDNHLHIEETSSLLRIANVYSASNNNNEALNYFRQAEKKLQSHPNDFYSAATANLIAITFEKMNMPDSALYYAKRVSVETFKNTTGPAIYFTLLGNIQLKLKNETPALAYYRQGIESAVAFNDLRTAAEIYIRVASVFKKNNNTDSAIHYALQGLATAERLSYKNRIMAASSLLAELYEPMNASEALKYHKIFSAARDSLYSTEKLQAFQTIKFNEQEKQREIEIAKTAFRNKVRMYVLVGGVGMLLLITLLLYRNNKHKQKANALLHKQKREIDIQRTKLQESLDNLKSTQAQLIHSEKMASLGELTAGIAHEIQNPLNFITNFSDLNTELIGELRSEVERNNLDEVKAIAKNIEENEEKINHHGRRADSIVKGMLQHSRRSTGIKESTEINKLADEYLRLSYHGLRAKDNAFMVNIDTNFDETIGNVNIIPQEIGRVLLNLYTNAFYAVTEKKRQSTNGYSPTVTVSTKRKDGNILISVKDNGNGIPEKMVTKIFEPFFTTKPTGQGTGLGLSLSYDIVKAHSGELTVETQEGEGTVFFIKLPV